MLNAEEWSLLALILVADHISCLMGRLSRIVSCAMTANPSGALEVHVTTGVVGRARAKKKTGAVLLCRPWFLSFPVTHAIIDDSSRVCL